MGSNRQKKKKSKKSNKKPIEIKNKETATAVFENSGQVEDETLTTSDKKEQRTNRTGAILAILALMIPLVGVLLYYTRKWGRILPEGLKFQCLLHIIVIGIVSTFSIIVLIDIVIIVWADLKRYDVLWYDKKSIKEVDYDSDLKYNNLLLDLKIFGFGFLFFAFSTIYLWLIYEVETIALKVVLGVVYVFLAISLAVLLCTDAKKRLVTQKKQWRSSIRLLVPKFVIAASIVIGTVVCSWFEVPQVIRANNSSEGIVIVDNYGVFPGDVITIKILKNKDTVFLKDVSGTELEQAKEMVIHNIDLKGEEPTKYIFLDEQNNYNRYVFDLRDVDLDEGNYNYEISVSKYNTKVILINEFSKDKDGRFVFAQPSLERKY